MKKSLIVLCSTVVALNTNAQLSINPEAGLNLSGASWKTGSNKVESKMLLGYKVGAVLDIGIVKGFYIQPGAFYSLKGAEFNTSVSGINSNIKTTLNYLEVPLNFAYRYDFNKAGAIFAAVGPYLGIGLNGKSEAEVAGIKNEEDIKFGDAVAEFKKLDYGVNFGVGYISPVGIYLRLQYGLGLANLSNVNNVSWKNGVFGVSLGYAFELNER